MANKRKILIIDDSDDIRLTYVDVFDKAGFQVSEATDGLAGLEKSIKEKPDIIFTGIIMPRMDGFALKGELAKNVATADIPVAMISHMGRKEDEIKARELGVIDFIVQGITSPKDVVNRINAILDAQENSYLVKIIPQDLDAPRLSSILKVSPLFQCPQCGQPMLLNLKSKDIVNREFSAKFICPECDK